MEAHFLADQVTGDPQFCAKPWYNPHGDCLVFQMADEAFVARRVDELLTVYDSVVDGRTIGFQIKGVGAIIRKCGFDGLQVSSVSDATGVKGIAITALLLAAYEDGPRTIRRRQAYATAMQFVPDGRILASELAASI